VVTGPHPVRQRHHEPQPGLGRPVHPAQPEEATAKQAGQVAAHSAPTDASAPTVDLGGAPVTVPSVGMTRTALDLYRDIVSHIHAIEQLATSPCLVPNGPDEEAEFDQLHEHITTRLARILHSLTAET
jgi:hypothetical protein